MMEGYQKDFPECPEYVLDVPQASAVIFSKKVKRFFHIERHITSELMGIGILL